MVVRLSMRLLAVAGVAMALVSPSAGLAPKVKVEQPPGFNMHSLHLYAPLSMSAMAAAYYGYDKKKLPVAALAPLLVLAAMLDWKASQYRALVKDNEVDIDGYTNSQPSLTERAKIVSIHGLSTGSHKRSLEAHKLAMTSSPFVPGLLASKLLADGLQPLKLGTAEEKPIVVGTIRMGFGHHRIAYSASSWALGGGSQTVFHDFLAIDSPEANLIKDADALYSRGSRLASELGGVVEKIWGSLTKSGDATSLRITNQLAECLRPLMLDLPKDTPIIATHSLVGLAAVACGFKNVINLVIDNYAQWFVVVPGAVNLVQGPTNFHQLSKMGIPEADIRLAGHWCPKVCPYSYTYTYIHTDVRLAGHWRPKVPSHPPLHIHIHIHIHILVHIHIHTDVRLAGHWRPKVPSHPPPPTHTHTHTHAHTHTHTHTHRTWWTTSTPTAQRASSDARRRSRCAFSSQSAARVHSESS